MTFGGIARKSESGHKTKSSSGMPQFARRHPAPEFPADRAGMDERFLVLLFKKDQHSLFEKREPKTFIHWLRSPVWPVSED
jgi:hypothetical protein